MKIKLDPANPQTWPKGRVNAERLDATTECELSAQQASDDAIAMENLANAVATSGRVVLATHSIKSADHSFKRG